MSRLDLRACASKTALGNALIVIAVLLAGCNEKLRDLTDPTPDAKPTFPSIQLEIFSSSDGAARPCCIKCHTNVGHAPMGGLNLLPVFSYASLVNVASRSKPGVIPVMHGGAGKRYLVRKLEGRSDVVGLRMPRDSSEYSTDAPMLVITRRIQLGAHTTEAVR